MAASLMARVKKAIKRAAMEGKDWLEVYGVTLLLEYVAGNEYRAVLENGGGEIVRYEMVGGTIDNMVTM